MSRPQVFLSSAMTGELEVERQVLMARFGQGTPLGEWFTLWTFEAGAHPEPAPTVYLREVEESPVAIFLFFEELRQGVRDEYYAADRGGAAIFCYIREATTRKDDLDAFINNVIRPQHKTTNFSSARDLYEKVEIDLQNYVDDLTKSKKSSRRAGAKLRRFTSDSAEEFCTEALEASVRLEQRPVPVDLSAHSLWGTVRPRSLEGLTFENQSEIRHYDAEIDSLALFGAVFPSLKRYAEQGLTFEIRILLLHPDSEQAREVHRNQRASSDPTERLRFALSDIYLTLYVLRRLAVMHPELGSVSVRVMPPDLSMDFSLTRIGGSALIAPFPRNLLLESTSSYILRGSEGDQTPFAERTDEFLQWWNQSNEYVIILSSLPGEFLQLRQRVDGIIKRKAEWLISADDGPLGGSLTDTTPFGTRRKLLTVYRPQVQEYWNGDDPFPVALEINPATYCDQGCHWCISEDKHHPGSALEFDHSGFRRFIQDFRRLGGQAVGWSGGGEPTKHPRLAHGMRIVRENNLAQGLMTHGAFAPTLVDPIIENCAWVRISIDTFVPEDYARKRGRAVQPAIKAFARVVENAKQLVAGGSTVGLNMNVARWNLSQVEEMYEWASSLGVAYLQVRPTLPTPFEHSEREDLLSREDIQQLRTRLHTLERKIGDQQTKLIVSYDKFDDLLKPEYGRTYKGCVAHRLFVVLNANGDLVVCMYQMTDQRFVFGNIYEHAFETIWRSDQRKAVIRFCRNDLRHGLHKCQVCCKGHEINRVLSGHFGAEIKGPETTTPFF
jgi:cyclic pyranopterin phosphate synthase